MDQKIFQVDAFTSKLFEGNPAAVCISDIWLSEETMQKIAMENNLAETAFLIKAEDEHYHLRWFTPTSEVDLCGHATLASAHVLFTEYGFDNEQIHFETKSGRLIVEKTTDGIYLMDFPCDNPIKVENYDHIAKAMNVSALECYRGKDDYLLILENEDAVLNARPNMITMRDIESRGVLLSAQGNEKDFVSRCFFPNVGVPEDPVTGSAHTLLTPYWAHKLRKNRLIARQISNRGGNIECIYKGDRVALIGCAVTYMKGIISIQSTQ